MGIHLNCCMALLGPTCSTVCLTWLQSTDILLLTYQLTSVMSENDYTNTPHGDSFPYNPTKVSISNVIHEDTPQLHPSESTYFVQVIQSMGSTGPYAVATFITAKKDVVQKKDVVTRKKT